MFWLDELYKSRAQIVAKQLDQNVQYSWYADRKAMLNEQLKAVDKMIERHLDIMSWMWIKVEQ